MPDISMCPSRECDARGTCRRNEASGTVPNRAWQSWMMFEPERGRECWGFAPWVAVADERVE